MLCNYFLKSRLPLVSLLLLNATIIGKSLKREVQVDVVDEVEEGEAKEREEAEEGQMTVMMILNLHPTCLDRQAQLHFLISLTQK